MRAQGERVFAPLDGVQARAAQAFYRSAARVVGQVQACGLRIAERFTTTSRQSPSISRR